MVTHGRFAPLKIGSEPFEVTHPWASFLVGGGSSRQTRVDIVTADDNRVFYGATGKNEENLRPVIVDLQPIKGKKIFIRIIDQASGGLAQIGPPVSSGNGPASVTVDPQGRFAYVINAIDSNISVFAIDGATGALTRATTAVAGTIPVTLTFDASGRFAYVANIGSDDVTVLAVDSNTGALTPSGPPVDEVTGPASIALTK